MPNSLDNCEIVWNSLIPHIFKQESFVQRGFERFIPHIIPHMILHFPLTSSFTDPLTQFLTTTPIERKSTEKRIKKYRKTQ